MTGYKIVRVKDGIRKSYAAHLPEKLIQTYKINRWVKPKVGKFFIFETYEDALDFLETEGKRIGKNYLGHYYEIWLVEIKGRFFPKGRILITYACRIKDFDYFWKNNGAYHPKSKIRPVGTLYCSKLKLVKKMKDFDF